MLTESNIQIKILAIYDTFYRELIRKISCFEKTLIDSLVSDSKIYSEDDNIEILYGKNDFDTAFICCENYKHYDALQAAFKHNKNIFCEKPLVIRMGHLLDINRHFASEHNLFFQTGLTLRYTRMCHIIQQHLGKIGKLNHVYGREAVNIGHAVHILTSWRRYRILTGGLGLEKAVHDYDLLLLLIKQQGIIINDIVISVTADKYFWTSDNRELILDKVRNDTNGIIEFIKRWWMNLLVVTMECHS